VPLAVIALVLLASRTKLFKMAQETVAVASYKPDVSMSETWLVRGVSDGDTLTVGIDGKEQKMKNRSLWVSRVVLI
jgi:hypothetical protein